eukprot:PhM_4_TR7713/c0_g1_i1/m.89909
MQRTSALLIRLPPGRRPRERPWEFLNIRGATGFKAGFHNYRTAALGMIATTSVAVYELFNQYRRVMARGDTCPVCERARRDYKEKMARRQKAMDPTMQQHLM